MRARLPKAARTRSCWPGTGCIRNCIACSSTTDSLMEQRLTALWYRESAGFSLLAPLGWLYAGVMALRRLAYAAGVLKTHRAGKPVIVVGNLTVGGTGKTPLVAWLAQQLSLTGLRVGIVSRGYGRSGAAPESVHA